MCFCLVGMFTTVIVQGSAPGRCTHTPPAAGERRDGCTTPQIHAWASTVSSSVRFCSLSSAAHLPVAFCSSWFLLPLSHLSAPSPVSHLHHLLQLMWLLVMIWNNLAKSISLCLRALSRTGCQSFFRGWNVAVFSPAGKLVLWEVEHVIRFTTAGSSETEFSHCRHYLINVMEWSLAFSGCHLKPLTQHIYPLVYILPLSYFLFTTSLTDWFCLFYSNNSFISPRSLPCRLCVCL